MWVEWGIKEVFSGVVKEPLRYRWNINDHKYVRGKEKNIITCMSVITCEGWRKWGEMYKKKFFKDKACFPTYYIGVMSPESYNCVLEKRRRG